MDGRHPVEVDAPSAFGDTKEPEVTAVHAKAQDSELSGNEIPIRTTSPPPPAATPAVQPAPAILPADLIQQFQNVLAQHTIAGIWAAPFPLRCFQSFSHYWDYGFRLVYLGNFKPISK